MIDVICINVACDDRHDSRLSIAYEAVTWNMNLWKWTISKFADTPTVVV